MTNFQTYLRCIRTTKQTNDLFVLFREIHIPHLNFQQKLKRKMVDPSGIEPLTS